MKRFQFLVLAVLAAVAIPACASMRYAALGGYSNPTDAANAIAFGGGESLITTPSTLQPYLRFTIAYCDDTPVCDPVTGICATTNCSFYVPPLSAPVNWHEFRAPASSDPWCVANWQHPAFSTPAACAAYWYDRTKSSVQYIGESTTSESTVILWWF